MRVSGPGGLTSKEKLAETIERVRKVLGLEVEDLCERMQCTKSQYLRIQEQKASLPLEPIFEFCKHINVSFENFMKGDIDFQIVAARWHGDHARVPERYVPYSFSKRRTSINVLDFVETFFGWRKRQNFLDHFQMTEAAFLDPDQTINLLFLTDLCSLLKAQNFSAEDFYRVGEFSFFSNRGNQLGTTLARSQNLNSLFENVIYSSIGAFDRNFQYQIVALTPNFCAIETKPYKDLCDGLSQYRPGSQEVCWTKTGVIRSFPNYMGLPSGAGRETKCIHRGDPVCRYEIDLSAPQAVFNDSVRSADFMN